LQRFNSFFEYKGNEHVCLKNKDVNTQALYIRQLNYVAMKKYRCIVCSHVYDPAEGDPDAGIAPGTAFENLPDDWVCSDCGALKADFEAMED
jgi:rubredoxin